MSRPGRYVKVLDEKTGTLHVYPRGTQIPMSRSGIIHPHPKAGDFDQIFARPGPARRGAATPGDARHGLAKPASGLVEAEFTEKPDAEKPGRVVKDVVPLGWPFPEEMAKHRPEEP